MKFKYSLHSEGKLFPIQEKLCYLGLLGMFRNMHLHNKENVPFGKPILLAVNHPTAFIEPIFLCTLLDPPIYNMTRGDIFKKPLFSKILRSFNMFPVFRSKDGYKNANRNDSVFEYCVDKMATKDCVSIYVEGMHHIDKQVRPVQKGIARIAFGAYERLQDDELMIVPIGCNFEHGDTFRDSIIGYVDEPIMVKDYMEEYATQPGHAIRRLCDDIHARLKEICYHVEEKADLELADQLLLLKKNDKPTPIIPIIHYNDNRFQGDKALLNTLNALEETPKATLKEKASQYFEALKNAGIEDFALVQPQWATFSKFLFLLLSFPLFLVGKIFHWLPANIAWYVAENKVKKREFYSSVLMGLSLLLSQVWYFGWFVFALITWNNILLAALCIMPVIGWFSVVWKELYTNFFATRKAKKSKQKQALLNLRAEIRTHF